MASRYILATVLLAGTQLAPCRAAFRRIFRASGLPAVIRVDNGTPFGATGAWGLTRLSAWWVKLGIRVEFIEPGRPDQNGAHEQMHRIYKAETLQPPAFTLAAMKRRTARWRHLYNHARPHGSARHDRARRALSPEPTQAARHLAALALSARLA